MYNLNQLQITRELQVQYIRMIGDVLLLLLTEF